MEISLLNVLLIMSVAFALWGTFRSLSQPNVNASLLQELERHRADKVKYKLDMAAMSIELDREKWMRRSIEEHYHECKKLAGANLPVLEYEPKHVARADRNYIVDTLSVYFTIDEMSEMAFKLGIPFDHIKHSTTAIAALEFAWYMERRNRFDDLVNIMDEERPLLNIKDNIRG